MLHLYDSDDSDGYYMKSGCSPFISNFKLTGLEALSNTYSDFQIFISIKKLDILGKMLLFPKTEIQLNQIRIRTTNTTKKQQFSFVFFNLLLA